MSPHRSLYVLLMTVLLSGGLPSAVKAQEEGGGTMSDASLCALAAEELQYFLHELQVAALLAGQAGAETDMAKQLVLEALPWSYGVGTTLWWVDETGRWVTGRTRDRLIEEVPEDVEPRMWTSVWPAGEPRLFPDWEKQRMLMIYPMLQSGTGASGALILTLDFPEFDRSYGLTAYSMELDRLYEVNARLNTELKKERPSVAALLERIRSEPEGLHPLVVMDEDGAFKTLDIAWCHFSFLDLDVIAVLELTGSEGEDAVRELPGLSGRWAGAYTEKRLRDAGDDAVLPKSGQLSAAILQDGERIELMTAGPGWRMRPCGVLVGDTLSAAHVEGKGTPYRVWTWDATYDAERDTIQGMMKGDAFQDIIERSFYMKRLDD